jgi:hypothetical protein
MGDDITKSSRHPKIAGDFGESLVLYWLSKSGFECARVDHTGIDLIANNPRTNEVMGISVKSRTRLNGTEFDSVNIKADNFKKIDIACAAFHCQPYFAIVVDAKDSIKVFILTKSHLLELFPERTNSYWKMTAKHIAQYANDPQIMAFELQAQHGCWWK